MENNTLRSEDLVLDLKRGLAAEESALDSYARLLEFLEDKEDIEIVKKIAEDEKRHIEIVKNLIRMVKQLESKNKNPEKSGFFVIKFMYILSPQVQIRKYENMQDVYGVSDNFLIG